MWRKGERRDGKEGEEKGAEEEKSRNTGIITSSTLILSLGPCNELEVYLA
jgi:hypothetical protein